MWLSSLAPMSEFRDWPPVEGFDVVHIGAALWVRTGSLGTWVPYIEEMLLKLEEENSDLMRNRSARRIFVVNLDEL
jgi:hypothetical protein